jgi:hypothetical protein
MCAQDVVRAASEGFSLRPAQIETRCSYVYTEPPGRPHVTPMAKANQKTKAPKDQGKKSEDKSTTISESVTSVQMAKQ